MHLSASFSNTSWSLCRVSCSFTCSPVLQVFCLFEGLFGVLRPISVWDILVRFPSLKRSLDNLSKVHTHEFHYFQWKLRASQVPGASRGSDLTTYVSLIILCPGLEASCATVSLLSSWSLEFFMAKTSMTKASREIIIFKYRLATLLFDLCGCYFTQSFGILWPTYRLKQAPVSIHAFIFRFLLTYQKKPTQNIKKPNQTNKKNEQTSEATLSLSFKSETAILYKWLKNVTSVWFMSLTGYEGQVGSQQVSGCWAGLEG